MWFRAEQRQYLWLVCAGVFLVLQTCLVHGTALSGWWRIDDPVVALYVTKFPNILGYFFSPVQWQELGVPFFTPWLILDFRIDQAMAGLQPWFFYLHHLAVIWLNSLFTFILLRRFVAPVWALVCAGLFLLGAPVVVVSQQLMSRHYPTGLLFAIVSILLWLHYREKSSWFLLASAVGFYLLALLNKEIFVPLPLVLCCLGAGRLRERLRDVLPFVIIAIVFIVWRAEMVGTLVGGYSGRLQISSGLFASYKTIVEIIFGPGRFALYFFSAMFVLAFYLFRRHFLLLIAAFIALSLPFLAVQASADVTVFRFAFLPWWAVSVLIAITCERLTNLSKWGCFFSLMPFVICFIFAVGSGRSASSSYEAVARTYDTYGHFFWSHGKEVGYVPEGDFASVIQFQYAVGALKEIFLSKHAPRVAPTVESAAWFLGMSSVYLYDIKERRMKKVEPLPQIPPVKTPDLDVRLDRQQGGFAWEIRAPEGSSCVLLFPNLNALIHLPCAGAIGQNPPPFLQSDLRVFVNYGNNRWAVTPVLNLPKKGKLLRWSSYVYE